MLLDRGQDVRIGMKSVVERSHRVQNLGRAFLVKVRNHNVVIVLAKFLNLSGAETRYVRVFLVELFDQWGTFGPFFLKNIRFRIKLFGERSELEFQKSFNNFHMSEASGATEV